MKIISKGTIPSEKVGRMTCGNCRTVFECTQGETTQDNSGDQRDASVRWIKCPVCKQATIWREYSPTTSSSYWDR